MLLVEGFVQGAVQKGMISVPFIKCFKAVSLKRLEAAIEGVL